MAQNRWVAMHGVYTLGTSSGTLLDLGFLGLLAPPSNRFVAPVVLAAILVFWQWPSANVYYRSPSTSTASSSRSPRSRSKTTPT